MWCPVVLAYGFNVWEIVIVGVVVLLLFGNRLPSLMGSLGKSVTEFKKGIRSDEDKDPDRVDDANRKTTPRE